MTAQANINEITAALSHIPSDSRTTWVTMGMAVKSELGEGGFDVWDTWSQPASNYNAKAAKSVWKGIKAAGGVTIATLFHEALANGWKPSAPYTPPTPEERAKIEAERQAAQAEAERIEAEQRAQAKAKAVRLWAEAGLVRPDHPYVAAKAIKPYGAKQLRDSLVLPLYSKGELVNLQFIGEDGTKRFLTGGQVVGACTVLGTIKDATTVLMCEGYATGSTLHEATGLPVVVCFNAHNSVSVAKSLAKAFNGQVLVCGDNDHETKDNPGKVAALKAANCFVGGSFALPDLTPEQIEQYRQQYGKAPTDWNDYAKLVGLDATREAIEAALPEQAKADHPEGESVSNLSSSGGDGGDGGDIDLKATDGVVCDISEGVTTSQNQSGDSGDKGNVPHGFLLILTSKKSGLYYLDPNGESQPRRISGPISVLAQTRDGEGKSWGRLLQWFDAEGRRHQLAMPASMTCGDSAELARVLVDSGLEVTPGRWNLNKLAEYVMAAKGDGFVRCTNRTGWHGDTFVLPNEVIAAQGAERVFLQAERDDSLGMTQAGTLDEWRDEVSALASGNSRVLFAISLAFAAPLADLAGESGGFHFVGGSSTGKSTTQLLAASVWGNPEAYKVSWKATGNGLEGVCAARNNLLLVLDELAEFDGKSAGEVAYMIANGQGKTRSARDGAARTPKRWLVLFLSSGEVPLAQHMAESGKQIRAGQEVRMVDIEADAGKGFGIFDSLTGGEQTGAALSERVKAESARYYGTAGRAFLRLVIEMRGELAKVIREAKADFIKEAKIENADGQVMRVIGRFALVGVAGELATNWGLTGWRQGEAWDAALRLFDEWRAARGGDGNSEAARGIAAVRAFLEAHGESRFTPWDADEETRQRTINRAGFRKKEDDGQWFYVLQGAYQKEVCKGFDHKQVSEALRAGGMLHISGETTGKGNAKRYTTQSRLPGIGRTRCYLITPAIWEGDA